MANIDPFMVSGPEYRRNWLGTVVSVIIFIFIVCSIINDGYMVYYTFKKEEDWKSWPVIRDFSIALIMLGLIVWVSVLYVQALRKPLILHGADSVYNLRPYRWYITIAIIKLIYNTVMLSIDKWYYQVKVDIIVILLILPLLYLPQLPIYWGWTKKNDAQSKLAKVFMPFLPKV